MEKVLIFESSKARNYWFQYIINYLRSKGFICKVYLYASEIWINGNRLMFKAASEINNIFMAGRRDTLYYKNIENKLEENFKETLGEILNGKERNINIR